MPALFRELECKSEVEAVVVRSEVGLVRIGVSNMQLLWPQFEWQVGPSETPLV